MKLRVVCRKVYDYVRYDLKEIAFPSSLPDPPHIKKRHKLTWKERYLVLKEASRLYAASWVRDIGPELRPNDYKKNVESEDKPDGEKGATKEREPSTLEDLVGDSPSTVSSHGIPLVSMGYNTQIVHPQNQLISTRLEESNYLIWRQQVFTAIKGYGLEDFVTGDGSIPERIINNAETQQQIVNPDFIMWQRQDQLLASWILSSLSEAVAARGGMETLRPALQRVYMTRASAYRDALKSFIEGYQEGIQQVMEKREDSKSQQGADTPKRST